MDFYELFSVIPDLHLMTLDSDRHMIAGDQDAEANFSSFLLYSDYMDKIYQYGKSHKNPYVISTYMGLVWAAVYEKKDDALINVHILGPIFFNPYDDCAMEQFLRKYEENGLSFAAKHKMIAQMQRIPVMNYSQFTHYCMMLHFLVNQEKIEAKDFSYMEDSTFFSETQSNQTSKDKEDLDVMYQNIWHFESLLLDEVEKGQDGIRASEISALSQKGALGLMPTAYSQIKEPMRIRKDTLLIINALECHKAISSGVLPALAYRMQEHYIDEIENSHSPLGMNELHQKIHLAYCDLVKKTDADKQNYSLPIRTCIAYLKDHVTAGVTTAQLAELTGYDPYYLNRIFKKEVGISPKQYYRDLKIQYAAMLLKNTTDPIADIADALCYSSYTHFCTDFKAVMDCTPTEYRKG